MTEERKLDKSSKDFIANVSHELRTPISMFQGYSEAIIDDIASTNEEKKEIAQMIYDESLRMGRLVNELLDLAQMEAGHVQLTLESVAMSEFTERVLRKFQGLAKEKHIKLSLNGKIEDEFEAMIDSDRIEQVLTNLIDNAIRHTDDYGEVKLHLDKSESEGSNFHVQDTGAGIPEEDLPFVFDDFIKRIKPGREASQELVLGLQSPKILWRHIKGSLRLKVN